MGFVLGRQGGGGGAVASVNGRTGSVIVTKTDVGLANVSNTADADKPISNAATAALLLKVDVDGAKQLSTEDYTAAEKTKLANLSNRFRGVYADLAAMQADAANAAPTGGWYFINLATGTLWSYDGFNWNDTGTNTAGDMLASVYDPTNVGADVFSMGSMVETATGKILTDVERTKLTALPEAVDLTADIAAKQDTLVSGTNLKTLNGETLLGATDIVIDGGTEGITHNTVDDTIDFSKDVNFANRAVLNANYYSINDGGQNEGYMFDGQNTGIASAAPDGSGGWTSSFGSLVFKVEGGVRGSVDSSGNLAIDGDFKSTGPNIYLRNASENGWYSSGSGALRPLNSGSQDVGNSGNQIRYFIGTELRTDKIRALNGGAVEFINTPIPTSNGGVASGASNFRWSTVYCNTLDESSDERYKDFTEEADYKALRYLKGMKYTWKEGVPWAYEESMGLSAQEVSKHFPELVNYDVKSDFYSLNYGRLVAPLINYCNAQQDELDDIKAKLEELMKVEEPKKKRWYYLWLI